MKKEFTTSYKWLAMTAICIIGLVFFSCSQDEWEPREVPEGYKPIFKEGKIWSYGTHVSGHKMDIAYIYTIKGDTTIKGNKYKKLYCTYEKRYGDSEPHYYAAVREESLRAFYILKGSKKEKLMFDFGTQEDETFKIGRLPDGTVKNLGISEPKDFLGTPRRLIQWGYIHKDGMGILTCYYWYEGIGNNPDLLNMEQFDWSEECVLVSCYEDGRCIYDFHVHVPPYIGG